MVVQRMRHFRTDRGWSAAELAEKMTAQGIPWTREVVANLELGRRSAVTVDELLALALVFVVPLANLMTDHKTARTTLTPKREVSTYDALLWHLSRVLPGLPEDDPKDIYAWNYHNDVLDRIAQVENTICQAQHALREESADPDGSAKYHLGNLRRRLHHARQIGIPEVPIPQELLDRAAELGIRLPWSVQEEES